jgi:hypothetical protein
MSRRCVECGSTGREMQNDGGPPWAACEECGETVPCDTCMIHEADQLDDFGLASCQGCREATMKKPKPARIIPVVNQVWKVENDKLVVIVALQSEDFVGVKQESPIKDRENLDRACHVAYSDGMTGVYHADTGIGLSSYRLVWCPFGQHEANKERETT